MLRGILRVKFRQYYKITDSAWGFFLGLIVPQLFFAILLIVIISVATSQGIDADAVKGELRLRHWQEGDVFRPIGLKGKKKVSDFFNDQKLSLRQKEKVWLVTDDENIIWIVGYRIDDRYKVKETTSKIMVVSI